MKKTLLTTLLMMLLSVAMFAAKEDSYVLYTGFEDGIVPEGWTQENVAGQTPWIVEKGDEAQYPVGAAAGDYRLLLRNTTSQTQRFVTRLITPVIDLRDVTLPVLMFSHAQQQRTGDVDTLRVYYRSSADSRWVLLATYPDKEHVKYAKWTEESIDLPAQTGTYQIAFEGSDNFGRGIALDEIIVRPMPTCDVPSNITVGGLTTTSATLSWLASMDADSIEVVVSKSPADSAYYIKPSDIVVHTFTDKFSYALDSLERNAWYYCYLNSYCANETSGWAADTFRTRNISDVPYVQDFNKTYLANAPTHMEYMTSGTSIMEADGVTMKIMPYVNRNTAEADWRRYAYDSTTCLVFSGSSTSVTSVIAAGEYAYCATPEMNVDDIRKLSVTFWGDAERYVGDDYAGGIIVGVMTNPDEYATFVPVDTCYLSGEYNHRRFTVDLKNYAGYTLGETTTYGKYIAFASDFKDKKNIFYLDNLTVDYTLEATIPQGLSYADADYNSLKVSVEDLGASTSWNLLIATDLVYNGSKPNKVIWEKFGLTEKTVEVKSDTLNGKAIYLYAQGVNGADTSIFALPVGLKMPRMQDTLPYEITFNAKELAKGYYTQSDILPFWRGYTTRQIFNDLIFDISNSVGDWPWYYSSAPAMVLRQIGGYIALPAVPDVKDVFMSFSISPYYSSATYAEDARVALGVMTNPYDPATFDSLAVFDGTGTTSPRIQNCSYAFVNYTGEGKYIAIKCVQPKSGKIDDVLVNIYAVSMASQSSRPRPYDVLVEAGADSAKIAWKGNTEAKHQVVITKMKPTAVSTDSYGTYSIQYVSDNTAVDTIVSGLDVNLALDPHSAYQLSVSVIYGNDTLPGIVNYSFNTDCREKESIPYNEDFEAYAANSQFKQYPACWIGSPWKSYNSGGSYSHTEYYPNISTSSLDGYTHSGKNILMLGASTTSTTDSWVALPEFDAEINTLELSMWIRPASTSYNDTIEIGLIPANATDLTAFEHIEYVKIQGSSTFKEYIVRMDDYQGVTSGKRICMVKRTAQNHYYYIDDLEVRLLSACPKIMDVELENIGTMGATAKWKSQISSEWEFLMTSKPMTKEGLDTIQRTKIDSTVVLLWENVTTNPYAFISDSAKINTTYYVYVRGICDGNAGKWSEGVSFATMCEGAEIDTYTENFSVVGNSECWTMGMRSGDIASTNLKFTNGYLYMFNIASTDGAYAIMPPMNTEDISKYQISFDAHGGTTTAYLKELTVGVITNASDLTTFEKMTTLKLNQVTATSVATNYGFDQAYRYTVRFDSYDGDWRGNKGNRVMFLSESGDKQNYIYIDNVSFNLIGDVEEPLEVWAEEVGEKYAVLVWDSVGTKYNVKVSSKKIDPANEVGDAFDGQANSATIRVEGLTMLTTYYVYVQTVGANGATSKWSNVRWFTTVCPPSYTLPYVNDFSGKVLPTSAPYDGVDCWQHYYDTIAIADYISGSSYYCRPYATANKAGTVAGDNGMYFGSTYGKGTTAPKSATAVLPAIDADLSKAMIEFDWKSSTTTNTDANPNIRKMAIGIANYAEPLDSVLETAQWVDTLTTEGYIGTWKHEMLPLNKYIGEGKYIVLRMFDGNNVEGTTAYYAYLDNLQVTEAPDVFAPASIECGKMFGSTAELTWTQTLGNYSQWQVVAVPTGDSIPANPAVQTFDTTACVFAGLTSATTYDFYVRAVASDGKLSPWVATPATGTTLYLVEVTDASWNFDSQATQEHYNNSTYWKEKGWLQGMVRGAWSNTYVPYLYANTINATSKLRTSWYSFSGDTCLRVYSTSTQGGYTVMPQINCNLDSMQLRFKINATYCNESTKAVTATYARGSYVHAVKVGYMTDPYDYSTFKEITTYNYEFPQSGTLTLDDDPTGNRFWQEVTIPLYGVGEGNYLVFSSDFTSGTNQIYIDDVIVEKEAGCSVPLRVAVDSLVYDAAKFVWGSGKTAWDVQVLTDSVGGGDSIVVATTVNELAFTAKALTEKTNYTFRVRSNCGEDNVSDWVSLAFTTPCSPTLEESASWGFVENLYQYGTSASYLIPECTAAGVLYNGVPNTSTTYVPYAITNAAATTYGVCYSRGDTVGGKALQFYTTSSYYNAYWVMPDLGFELDSMTLHFWGRAARFNSCRGTNATYVDRIAAVNSSYSRTLIIGVVTDASDISTFIPLDTIMYDKVWKGTINTSMADRFQKDDKTGNSWWQEYALPLAKYAGKGRITFLAPKPTATSYFYIDDVEVVKGTFCTAPSGVRISEIGSRFATIAWNLPDDACDSVAIEFYAANKDGSVSDTVLYSVDSLITSRQLTFDSLTPATKYYYRIKHLCSAEEESAWSDMNELNTSYEAPLFTEDFQEERTYPVNWTRGGSTSAPTSTSSTASDIASFIATGKVGAFTSDAATSNAAWRRNSDDQYGMGDGSIYSILSTGTGSSVTYSFAWLFTPVIYLDNAQAQNMMLSFDMGMWNSTRKSAPKELGLNDQFVILVSEDGGESWSMDNTFSWKADGTGDYDYNEVQNERRTWYVDMTKYLDKSIKIAFYAESRTYQGVNTGNYLYLDNVQLNAYTKNEYDAQICRWNDYADATFEIDAYDLKVGKTTRYDEYIQSQKKENPDKLTILNLAVECDTITQLSATVCEGGDYEENGFVIHNATSSDTYKRKLSGENKCDSIVELQLNVIPKIRVNLEETICQGVYYEFNGVKYYTNTTITETFTATSGCDSIVTLYLTVAPILESEPEEVYLCPGKSYNFTEKYPEITEAGTYVDTLVNARGCDSLVTLTVHNVPAAQTLIRAAICQGDRYDEYPFRGLQEAGDWESKLETVYGCDSIVTLHLLVAAANTETQSFELYDTISSANLPYVLNGLELLQAGTERGVYTRPVTLGCGEATVVINVDNADGIDDIFANTLAVTPNPVSVGEAVRVMGQFSNAEVEVITATGAVAYRQHFTTGQITLPGISAAGIYLVRLTDNKGEYHAKLVVK